VFSPNICHSHYLAYVKPSPTSTAVPGSLPPPAIIHYDAEVLQHFQVH
jgi:hypothetical protein